MEGIYDTPAMFERNPTPVLVVPSQQLTFIPIISAGCEIHGVQYHSRPTPFPSLGHSPVNVNRHIVEDPTVQSGALIRFRTILILCLLRGRTVSTRSRQKLLPSAVFMCVNRQVPCSLLGMISNGHNVLFIGLISA